MPDPVINSFYLYAGRELMSFPSVNCSNFYSNIRNSRIVHATFKLSMAVTTCTFRFHQARAWEGHRFFRMPLHADLVLTLVTSSWKKSLASAITKYEHVAGMLKAAQLATMYLLVLLLYLLMNERTA